MTQDAAIKDRWVSYEAFLEQADEDVRAEWVDGKVVRIGAESHVHQALSGFLAALLRAFVEAYDLGVVLSAPFQMKLEQKPVGREPDILFVAQAHLERLKTNYLDGPADLVVEIISLESRARDRGEKFYEYEQAGIPEYWLLDPERKQAEFYQRDEGGIYQLVPLQDGSYRSRVLEGLWLKPAWLWQDPLPKLLEVLKSWKLV